MAVAQVEALARSLGVPRTGADPQELILEEIAWCAGHVEFYRAQVQALDPDALIKGVRGITKSSTSRTGKLGYDEESTASEVGPLVHAWLDRYDKERDRLAALCVQAVRLGIEQKRVEQERAYGRRLAEALRYAHDQVLRLVKPSPEGADAIRGVFIDAIRVMTLGAPMDAIASG